MSSPLKVAVALEGAGWHPAAWREPSARPAELFEARYWVELARTAERGGVDFVTFEDAYTLQSADPRWPDARTDQVRGRLDAALLAARVAPATEHVGLVPTVTTTHTEPFHVATKVAALDWVSRGRAGWRVQVQRQEAEVALFGRRDHGDRAEARFDEAADAVEVGRRLWDSWEDDAEIRHRPTGRFIDRDKLHTIDFVGRSFSVRGPAITPRSPQGQPLVAVLAHVEVAYELAARCADVVFVTPHDGHHLRAILAEVRAAERRVGRPGPPLLVFADLLVLLAPAEAEAVAAEQRLDQLDGAPLRTDAPTFTGTPEGLVDRLARWEADGIAGVRLRPARLPRDLDAIVDEVLPRLEEVGLFAPGYHEPLLRVRLGLERPASRYAAGERSA